MSRTIDTWRDPYDIGVSMTTPKQITIEKGLTVLVGCNGCGKTTLLHNIKQHLERNKIPFYFFDNLKDGGTSSMEGLLYHGNMTGFATIATSSEGENIGNYLTMIVKKIHYFIRHGEMENNRNPITGFPTKFNFFRDEDTEPITSNERWILFDAIDSGFSIDNVLDFKETCKLIIEDGKSQGINVYIIAAANEYELAANENCFDVMKGKYIHFSTYEEYKDFVLKTRDNKIKRFEKIEKHMQRKQKKKQKRIETLEKRIRAIEDKAKQENRELTYSEQYRIDDLKRDIRNIDYDYD